MILVILVLLFLFVYPFVGKSIKHILIAVLLISIIAGFIYLSTTEEAIAFGIYGLSALSIGSIIRYFYFKSKYRDEAEDLISQYTKDNKNSD